MERFFLLALIAAWLTACRTADQSDGVPPLTTTAPRSAAHCTPDEVAAFLDRFLDAFNRGDLEALRTFFPAREAGRGIADHTREKFVWYSMTDQRLDGSKRHFVAYDLPALWTYFEDRHARQERLRLASLDVRPQGAVTADLTVNLHRTADDVPPDAGYPPGQATGKAVVNCRDHTILVWSLGQGRDPTPTPVR